MVCATLCHPEKDCTAYNNIESTKTCQLGNASDLQQSSENLASADISNIFVNTEGFMIFTGDKIFVN